MKIGVVLPQGDLGPEGHEVKSLVTAVERLGFSFLLAYDHVVAARPEERRPGWPDIRYTVDDPFWEPLSLFAYASALTDHLLFYSGVLVLPQRQTALVAKQSAVVDCLSGGRLRLGVGLGWNELEYEALGVPFSERGGRLDEQIEVLRRLWSETVVEYQGRYHDVPDVGINPRPKNGDVPLLMGGMSEPAMARAAREGIGWMPQFVTDPQERIIERGETYRRAQHAVSAMRALLAEQGRDPADFEIHCRMNIGRGQPEEWRTELEVLEELGATHVGLLTLREGLTTAEEHIDRITRFREAVR